MPASSRGLRLAAAIAVAGLALTGCSGGGVGGGSSKGKSAAKTTNRVQIKNFKFVPENIAVKAGTVVTWTNSDSTDHTVTASDKSFDSKNLGKDKSYSFTFSKPGTYDYICTIHQYMKGTVKVT
ncbi:MAG: cupredoxin family copper-binding protein [Actinomycetota bacterium]|nr:cupredoxin family copper-binding protein [Actinomycetota bacterium]